MRDPLIAIDRAGRGALASGWIATPGWKRARVRVEVGLGADLGVRIRGRASPTATMGGPPPFELAALEPLEAQLDVELEGAGSIQVVAQLGTVGRRVRISLEEAPDA